MLRMRVTATLFGEVLFACVELAAPLLGGPVECSASAPGSVMVEPLDFFACFFLADVFGSAGCFSFVSGLLSSHGRALRKLAIETFQFVGAIKQE